MFGIYSARETKSFILQLSNLERRSAHRGVHVLISCLSGPKTVESIVHLKALMLVNGWVYEGNEKLTDHQ